MLGFIIFIIVILIFLFWMNRPNDRGAIVLYFANIGTGKTTFLSKLAIKEQKRIQKGKSRFKYVMSNALISGCIYEPNIRKLLQSGAIANTLILIDEGSIIYNNRKQTMTEKEIQYFKLIRHYSSRLIVVSQSYEDIDITLRRLYSEIYLLNWLPWFTMIRPIKKRVGIDEISKQIIDEYKFKSIFSWSVFFRPIYFKYFNSWWIPDDVDVIDLEIEQFRDKVQPLPKQAYLQGWFKGRRILGIKTWKGWISDKKLKEKLKEEG